MIKKLLGISVSTAHIKDQKLVLSLADAMTPAVWIVDLTQSPTLLFKVEETSDGLFVLQKIENGNAEELGYFKKRGHAVRAMENATIALQNKNCALWSLIKLGVLAGLIVVILSFASIDFGNVLGEGFWNFTSFFDTQTIDQSEPVAPQPSTNPDAVGVPLSADDFLMQRRSTNGLPF